MYRHRKQSKRNCCTSDVARNEDEKRNRRTNKKYKIFICASLGRPAKIERFPYGMLLLLLLPLLWGC